MRRGNRRPSRLAHWLARQRLARRVDTAGDVLLACMIGIALAYVLVEYL